MVFDKKKVEKKLKQKGFRQDNNKHRYFIYWTNDNKKTNVNTHTSHGKKKDIDDGLIELMADQCKLDKKGFIKLIQCPMSRDEYEAYLKSKKAI